MKFKTQNNSNGIASEYYYIVKVVRKKDKVKQKVLMYLGAAEKFTKNLNQKNEF